LTARVDDVVRAAKAIGNAAIDGTLIPTRALENQLDAGRHGVENEIGEVIRTRVESFYLGKVGQNGSWAGRGLAIIYFDDKRVRSSR